MSLFQCNISIWWQLFRDNYHEYDISINLPVWACMPVTPASIRRVGSIVTFAVLPKLARSVWHFVYGVHGVHVLLPSNTMDCKLIVQYKHSHYSHWKKLCLQKQPKLFWSSNRSQLIRSHCNQPEAIFIVPLLSAVVTSLLVVITKWLYIQLMAIYSVLLICFQWVKFMHFSELFTQCIIQTTLRHEGWLYVWDMLFYSIRKGEKC